MCKVLVIYHWDNGRDAIPEFREVSSLSDLDILVQEEMHESIAFDDAVKKIEFYVRVEGKFPKYILTKEVGL
jgi:hypothetical protein